MVGARIFCVVVQKFGYLQKSYPIVLFKFDKGPKIGFYYTILTFCLAVFLRLKGSQEFPLDANEVAE